MMVQVNSSKPSELPEPSEWEAVGHHLPIICRNAHVITYSLQLEPQQHHTDFCETCGERAYVSCPECHYLIHGAVAPDGKFALVQDEYERDMWVPPRPHKLPSYCYHCSEPYPWTVAAFQRIEQLTEGELSPQEQRDFARALKAEVEDLPDSSQAKKTIQRIAQKLSATTWEEIKDIVARTFAYWLQDATPFGPLPP